jgi:hypothetical protein
MTGTADAFRELTRQVNSTDRIFYPLAELNDLLTPASRDEIAGLPMPEIQDAYRLNYVTANGRTRRPSRSRSNYARTF